MTAPLTWTRQPAPIVFPTLCSMALITQAGSFLYLPALPSIAVEFAASQSGVQNTVVTYLCGSLFGFAFFGPLCDRFGRTAMLAVAGVLFVAGSAACAMAQGLGMLGTARFVQGAGSVAGIITARTVIKELYPPGEAVRLVSLVSATSAATVAASPILGALLLTMISWRAGFWVTAAFGSVAIATGLLVVPGPSRRSTFDGRRSIQRVTASSTWRACILVTGGTTSAFMVMMAASPFVYITTFGMSPVAYSWIMASVLCAFGIVAARTGRLAGRLGAKRAMRLAVGPMAGGAVAVLIITSVAPGPWALTAALMVTVGSMGVLVPSAHLAMLTPFPDMAGTAASLGMLATTSFGALSVWMYSEYLTGSMVGYGLAIAVLTSLAAVGWLLLPVAEAN